MGILEEKVYEQGYREGMLEALAIAKQESGSGGMVALCRLQYLIRAALGLPDTEES